MTALCLNGCAGTAKKDSDENQKPVFETIQEETKDPMINEETGDPEYKGEQEYSSKEDDKGTAQVSGEYYDGANLQGSVVSFDENGFMLSSAALKDTGDGGSEMVQAAPGNEDESSNVQITYADNVVFEEVYISRDSLSEISRSYVSKDVLKKQSDVCVFGSCQDTYHWVAEKILMLRWQ